MKYKIVFVTLSVSWTAVISSCAPVSTPVAETLEVIPYTASVTADIPKETALPANQNGTIQFSGYEWTIRENGLSGPGPNTWSRENVWLDEVGDLHLKISHGENGWQCAELTTTERFGFGTYQFQVDGPIDQLDAEVLFQLMDKLAGSRLRNAVFISGAGETPAADDVAKDFERL